MRNRSKYANHMKKPLQSGVQNSHEWNNFIKKRVVVRELSNHALYTIVLGYPMLFTHLFLIRSSPPFTLRKKVFPMVKIEYKTLNLYVILQKCANDVFNLLVHYKFPSFYLSMPLTYWNVKTCFVFWNLKFEINLIIFTVWDCAAPSKEAKFYIFEVLCTYCMSSLRKFINYFIFIFLLVRELFNFKIRECFMKLSVTRQLLKIIMHVKFYTIALFNENYIHI